MKKIITLITLILSLNLFSQKGKIFIETNYNTFSHSSLSNFQKELANDINPQIPIAITDDFSSHVGFTLGYEITDIKTSIFVSYNSTGGKISYSDFSGVIRLEQPLSAFTLGGMYHLNLSDKFKIGFKGFAMFSNLKLDSYSKIGSVENKNLIKLSSIDIGVGTSLIYEYPISFFIIRANIGFDLTLGNQLNINGIQDAYLINKSGKQVTTGWTGFRSGLGIAIPIN
ncbi:hypothetical protein F7018_15900 [Tenacibaculum aiptasiae]|uniref:Outer membrane protein beta-barrel domain-containing protein n=1 Tax=Tenacibaculum aiptasiae TaxID=426481 RepID=A0A7J5A8S4_9FLAO|nr:hypothetical protein [Tenacibaculum aiptasiae]KAB1153966.1 hypothetical protein F7018_15900 [Tenacibaculum aiptasiae]